jgi:hypothetical protein
MGSLRYRATDLYRLYDGEDERIPSIESRRFTYPTCIYSYIGSPSTPQRDNSSTRPGVRLVVHCLLQLFDQIMITVHQIDTLSGAGIILRQNQQRSGHKLPAGYQHEPLTVGEDLPSLAELSDTCFGASCWLIGETSRSNDSILKLLSRVKLDFGVVLGFHVCHQKTIMPNRSVE